MRPFTGETMAKVCEVKDPNEFFSRWHYEIIPAHWNTLGVVSTFLIDAEKSKVLRMRLEAEGLEHKEAMKRSIQRHAYVNRVHSARLRRDKKARKGEEAKMPPQEGFAFAEGYVFYSKHANIGIQVLYAEDDMIEACAMIAEPMQLIQPYRLPPRELAEWLRTGQEPKQREIGKYQVRSELMRLAIRDSRAG
jgi:hypothetical protein